MENLLSEEMERSIVDMTQQERDECRNGWAEIAEKSTYDKEKAFALAIVACCDQASTAG